MSYSSSPEAADLGQPLSCPDCARTVPVPPDPKPNTLVECPDCAGIFFRLLKRQDKLKWTWVHQVSCPGSDELVEVVHGTPVGTVYHCGSRPYILTYAFGSYALERPPGDVGD